MTRTEEEKEKINSRKNYYATREIMQMNSSVRKAKNSSLPFLNKKQLWLYGYLSANDISKNYIYTLDSLSNCYRKHIADEKKASAKKSDYQFRKSFLASEKIQDSDFKSVAQYFYIANSRQFEMYKNEKDNYIIHEVEFTSNLVSLKDRK